MHGKKILLSFKGILGLSHMSRHKIAENNTEDKATNGKYSFYSLGKNKEYIIITQGFS